MPPSEPCCPEYGVTREPHQTTAYCAASSGLRPHMVHRVVLWRALGNKRGLWAYRPLELELPGGLRNSRRALPGR